jgi:hypothetical protein
MLEEVRGAEDRDKTIQRLRYLEDLIVQGYWSIDDLMPRLALRGYHVTRARLAQDRRAILERLESEQAEWLPFYRNLWLQRFEAMTRVLMEQLFSSQKPNDQRRCVEVLLGVYRESIDLSGAKGQLDEIFHNTPGVVDLLQRLVHAFEARKMSAVEAFEAMFQMLNQQNDSNGA